MLLQACVAIPVFVCGFAAGVYVNHAHRSRKPGPRWFSGAVLIGGLVVLQAVHVEVWTLAGYLVGMFLAFALSHVILDRHRAGGRDAVHRRWAACSRA